MTQITADTVTPAGSARSALCDLKGDPGEPFDTRLVRHADHRHCGCFNTGAGLWAFAGPRSFYDLIATYPPYNAHFIRDIGAFLLGLGAVLIGALVWRDAAFVVLLGSTVAAGFHWASHLIDRHHGGTGADPWLTGLFALLLLAGLVLRAPARQGSAPAKDTATVEGARR